MFEKLQDILKLKYKDDPIELKKRLSELPNLHNEIKDNIMYLFYVLIIVVVLSVGDKLILKLNVFWSEFQYIPNSILLTIFLLSIVALKDLIVTSFAISDFIIKGNTTE
jgi:hypothetical protein